MRILIGFLFALTLGCTSRSAGVDSYDDVVERATSLYESGRTDEAIHLLSASPTQHPQPSYLLAHAELAYDLPEFRQSRLSQAERVLERIPLANFPSDHMKAQVLAAKALVSIGEGDVVEARAYFIPLCPGTEAAFVMCFDSLVTDRLKDLELNSRPRSARESIFMLAKVADTIHPHPYYKAATVGALIELNGSKGLRLREQMIRSGQYNDEVRAYVCDRLQDIEKGYSPLVTKLTPALGDVYMEDCASQ